MAALSSGAKSLLIAEARSWSPRHCIRQQLRRESDRSLPIGLYHLKGGWVGMYTSMTLCRNVFLALCPWRCFGQSGDLPSSRGCGKSQSLHIRTIEWSSWRRVGSMRNDAGIDGDPRGWISTGMGSERSRGGWHCQGHPEDWCSPSQQIEAIWARTEWDGQGRRQRQPPVAPKARSTKSCPNLGGMACSTSPFAMPETQCARFFQKAVHGTTNQNMVVMREFIREHSPSSLLMIPFCAHGHARMLSSSDGSIRQIC